MESYIGTKLINAKPMNRLEYNQFRGWELPADENGADEGYLVEYPDGGQANTAEFKGYVSWSPKKQFDDAYKQSGNLSFGDALEYLKRGHKLARSGWNGKGMYLYLAKAIQTTDQNAPTQPFIMMYTSDLNLVPWLASQSDMLATDWCLVN